MSSPPAGDLDDIVTRLRSAGCVYADEEARLLLAAAGTPAELTTMVEQRIAGSPLEHVLGWALFCDRRIVVGAGVFVPRRRTELLARQAIRLARASAVGGRRAVVVDLCCGAGAVGAAVLAALEDIELHAGDIDPVAVQYAHRNLEAAGGRVYRGDLFDALPAGLRARIDVVVANTPYVPTDALALMPAEARLFEPRAALDGGPDGLSVQRRLCAAAPHWLAPGGHLLVETSAEQAGAVLEVVTRSGLAAQVVHSAELDATVVIGRQSEA